MRIHLVAPRNPESFWTMTRILRTLGKRCVFPNLALPTLAGLTPPDWEVSLCDENVEEVDFDFDADIVGITGYIVHKKRMFELIEIAIRKPARLRDAVTLALMHKHFYEYVGELSEGLDRLIESLRECPDSVALLPEPAPARPNRRR